MEITEELDLTNCRFGRLRVIRKAPDDFECHCKRWRTACDCGNTREVHEIALIENRCISCGCQNQVKPNPLPERIKWDSDDKATPYDDSF